MVRAASACVTVFYLVLCSLHHSKGQSLLQDCTNMPALNCSDVVSTTINGDDATGLLLSDYSCGTILFMGCIDGSDSDCSADNFTCTTVGPLIVFDGAGAPLSVVLGPGSLDDAVRQCATAAQPQGITHMAIDADSTNKMCSALGYTRSDEGLTITATGCPTVNKTSTCFGTDFAASDRQLTALECAFPCTAAETVECEVCVTDAPTAMMTSAPPLSSTAVTSAQTMSSAALTSSDSSSRSDSDSDDNDSGDDARAVPQIAETNDVNEQDLLTSEYQYKFVIEPNTLIQVLCMMLILLTVNVAFCFWSGKVYNGC